MAKPKKLISLRRGCVRPPGGDPRKRFGSYFAADIKAVESFLRAGTVQIPQAPGSSQDAG
jgi:hypothetical protein